MLQPPPESGFASGPDPATFSLDDLRAGATGRVRAVGGDAVLRPRLLELGLLPGIRVRLVRRAPLGCPVEIEVGGSRFFLRREVAREVHLDPDV